MRFTRFSRMKLKNLRFYWCKRFDKFHVCVAPWWSSVIIITNLIKCNLSKWLSISFQDEIFVIKSWRDRKGLAEKMCIHQYFGIIHKNLISSANKLDRRKVVWGISGGAEIARFVLLLLPPSPIHDQPTDTYKKTLLKGDFIFLET